MSISSVVSSSGMIITMRPLTVYLYLTDSQTSCRASSKGMFVAVIVWMTGTPSTPAGASSSSPLSEKSSASSTSGAGALE